MPVKVVSSHAWEGSSIPVTLAAANGTDDSFKPSTFSNFLPSTIFAFPQALIFFIGINHIRKVWNLGRGRLDQGNGDLLPLRERRSELESANQIAFQLKFAMVIRVRSRNHLVR